MRASPPPTRSPPRRGAAPGRGAHDGAGSPPAAGTGAASSGGYGLTQPIEPTGKSLPVDVAVKPKVTLPSGGMVRL